MTRKRTIPFARGLSLPEEAVTETFAFIGRRGSGKTYGCGVLVEGMLDIGAQVVIFDPIGNWYGLRAGRVRFNVPILGGEHGDIPLEPTGGSLIANIIIDKNTSAVLDLSSFTKKQRRTFVADFAERLFHRKKTKRSPLHVVFEEAQVFAPQRIPRGEERMLGAVEDIVRLGRNYGIGVSLITQRPQSVNKEVLNQVEALVVFQINGSHERKAIEAWVVHQGIDTHEMVKELPSLPRGTAFLWSPQWLGKLVKIRVLKKRSADTSATPTVSSRKHAVASTTPLSKKDLATLQKAMADTVERAKENDPKELRRLIAELERQLQKVPAARVERIEVPVLYPTDIANIQTEIGEIKGASEMLANLAASLQKSLDRCQSAIAKQPAPPTGAQRGPTPQRVHSGRSGPTPRRTNGASVHLRKGALRMLGCMGALYPTTMTKRQVAGAAKMKSTGGTFNTYWGDLRKNGFMTEVNDGRWQITDEGFTLLGASAPTMPKDMDGRLDYWRERLRAGAVRILDELHRAWIFDSRAGVAKDVLATNVDMTVSGGTFNTYLGILKNNGLADKDIDGKYYLSAWVVRGDT